MNKKYHLYQIDSFTKEKFTGNPAGVITNADGLTEIEMQKIARELNNSLFKSKAKQGEAIKRAGIVDVEVKIENEEPVEVKISGDAIIAFQSEITI